jgi:hypothetical protein
MAPWKQITIFLQSGQIGCQILSPGGSMSPRYVLQLLFGEKSQIHYLRSNQ